MKSGKKWRNYFDFSWQLANDFWGSCEVSNFPTRALWEGLSRGLKVLKNAPFVEESSAHLIDEVAGPRRAEENGTVFDVGPWQGASSEVLSTVERFGYLQPEVGESQGEAGSVYSSS